MMQKSHHPTRGQPKYDPNFHGGFNDVCQAALDSGFKYVINPIELYREVVNHKDYVKIVSSNDYIPYNGGDHDIFLVPKKNSTMAFSEELAALVMTGAPVASVASAESFMFIPIAYCVRFADSNSQVEFALMFNDHAEYDIKKSL